MTTRFFKQAVVPVLASVLVALVLAGCATPRYAPGTSAPATAADITRAPLVLTPAQEARILVLDPERISDQDVRTTLAAGPTPHIILLHGGVYGTHLLMMNFARFLIAMGYPEAKIRDPSDGAYSQSPYGSSARTAGQIAWYYEHDGVRPLLIGHSQGGIQAVKVLYELKGEFADRVAVWNPATDMAEDRYTIVDPVTGAERPVIGVSVAFAGVVGAGGVALASPAHWAMAKRLHTIPSTVDQFTGYAIDNDLIAMTFPGDNSSAFRHNGTAEVRNVSLPASYDHVFVPVTLPLARDASMRAWLNAYVPGANNAPPPNEREAGEAHALFAADIWFSIKKSWCLEAQRYVRAMKTAAVAG
ncbi:MAG: hypothetical protein ABI537_03295 [Casimicrobiaceae bacterium]